MGPACAAPIDARSRRPRERASRPAAARRGLSTDDTGSPVTADYPAGAANALSGTIRWIKIELGSDDHTHQIPADLHFEVAMTRQ